MGTTKKKRKKKPRMSLGKNAMKPVINNSPSSKSRLVNQIRASTTSSTRASTVTSMTIYATRIIQGTKTYCLIILMKKLKRQFKPKSSTISLIVVVSTQTMRLRSTTR